MPATHGPLQSGVDSPVVLPNRPIGHTEHVTAPLPLHCPAMQFDAVDDVDPAAHAYPALQLPLHVDVVSPDVAPNDPASQSPLQFALDRPMALP